MNGEADKLLDEVKCADEHYADKRKAGIEFNIFDLFHAAGKEVAVCRVIRDLLDPDGSHGQGAIFLEKFFAIVLGNTPLPQGEIQVIAEYALDTERRIDLLIKSPTTFIPIEVKIYAGDQPKQCQDYWYAIGKLCPQSQNCFIWYLTLDGHQPSKDSQGTLNDTDIKQLSFQGDIISWLLACLVEAEKNGILPLQEIIKQFITAIQKWAGKMDDLKYGGLKELLKKDTGKLLLANHLAQAVEDLKRGLLERIFAKFDERLNDAFMQKHGLAKTSALHGAEAAERESYADSKKLEEFFKSADSGENAGHIGLTRIFSDKPLDAMHDICLCVEVEWNLYAQLMVYDYNDHSFQALNKTYLSKAGLLATIENLLKEVKWDKHSNVSGNWIYLPLTNKKEATDLKHYKEYNDEILSLYDDIVLEKAVAKSLAAIERDLLTIFR